MLAWKAPTARLSRRNNSRLASISARVNYLKVPTVKYHTSRHLMSRSQVFNVGSDLQSIFNSHLHESIYSLTTVNKIICKVYEKSYTTNACDPMVDSCRTITLSSSKPTQPLVVDRHPNSRLHLSIEIVPSARVDAGLSPSFVPLISGLTCTLTSPVTARRFCSPELMPPSSSQTLISFP